MQGKQWGQSKLNICLIGHQAEAITHPSIDIICDR